MKNRATLNFQLPVKHSWHDCSILVVCVFPLNYWKYQAGRIKKWIKTEKGNKLLSYIVQEENNEISFRLNRLISIPSIFFVFFGRRMQWIEWEKKSAFFHKKKLLKSSSRILVCFDLWKVYKRCLNQFRIVKNSTWKCILSWIPYILWNICWCSLI